MGKMNVEHVLLFLVGAFLAYHMMCNCGCIIEGNDNHNQFIRVGNELHFASLQQNDNQTRLRRL